MSDPVVALVDELEATTSDQPTMPLKHHQITEYHEQLRRLGGSTDSAGEWAGLDPTTANRRVREIRKILADQAPKPITGPRANQVYRLLERVKTEIIQPAMLPQSVMRHSPAGSVGEFQRREGSPFYKRAALAFKRGVRGLDPDNADPDLTNLERQRPAGTGANGTSVFMADAIIPGNFAFGPQAKVNWPLGEPTADTALAQAKRREKEDIALAIDRTRDQMAREAEQRQRDLAELERLYAAIPAEPERVLGALAVEPERQGKKQRRLRRLAGESNGNGHRKPKKTKAPKVKRVATAAQLAALARAQDARRAKRAAAAQDPALIAAGG